MYISQLVLEEFEQIFPSILKNSRVELSAEDLMDAPNSYIIAELNKLKGVNGTDEDERTNLLQFILLMEEAEAPLDFDEEINQMLADYINNYPGIRSFKFFLIRYRLNHYLDGGIDKNTLCAFYRDVVEEGFLAFDDFVQHTNFHLPTITLDEPSIELISIFQNAVQLYPKAILKFTLGHLLTRKDGELENALEYFLQFIEQIEDDRTYNESNDTYEYRGDSITYEEFHIALSTITNLLYKQKKEYKNALDYTDKCLKEYQIYSEDVYAFQILFVNPLTVRLRIHIEQGNIDEFLKDYQLLRSKIDDADSAEMDDIDDIKEFAKRLKM